MIGRALMENTWLRKLSDALPANNRFVQFGRAFFKALFLRKTLAVKRRISFEGIEDAIFDWDFCLGPSPDEILVRSLITAVSPGTEKGYFQDLPNFHQTRPYLPGYSGCGQVRSAGKNVADLKKKDLVAGILKHSSLNVIDNASAVSVPPEVKPQDAAFVTLGVIALCGVRAAGNVEGSKVVVAGQGIIGQLVNQLARAGGAGKIIAIALGPSKREMAEKSGVDEFIALKGRTELLNAIAADVVIDSTGSFKGFENSLEMVKPGGRVVMLGSIPDYSEDSDWARLVVEKGIEVRGAHVRNLEAEGLTYRGEAKRFLELLAERKVKVDHLVTDVYKPEDAPEIYRRLASGDRNMAGVVIEWR